MKYNDISIDDLVNEFNFKIDLKKLSILKKEDIKDIEKKDIEKTIYKTSTTWESFQKYKIEEFKRNSKEKEFKQFMFAQTILVNNTLKNEAYKLNHDILQKSRDTYLYFFYTQKLLEEKYNDNEKFVAIFLTLTCPSKFHQYSTFTKKPNPNFDKKLTINDAYKLLNSTFREIYKNFMINRKFEKIEYSKVIEPHKNFTPHLHSILYVKKEFVKNLVHHIENIIQKNQIGENKIEVLSNVGRGASYLLKYVQKTTNPNNEEDFHFFNGWKKTNKIRVFTCSSSILQREIYKKINSVTKLSNNLENKNPIKNVLENCYIKIKQTNIELNEDDEYIEVGYKKEFKGNKRGRYLVNFKKEKIKKEVFIGNHFFKIINLEEKGFSKKSVLSCEKSNFEIFLCEYQNYLNIKFKIFKKHKRKVRNL